MVKVVWVSMLDGHVISLSCSDVIEHTTNGEQAGYLESLSGTNSQVSPPHPHVPSGYLRARTGSRFSQFYLNGGSVPRKL